jgi:lipoic acid synthetase
MVELPVVESKKKRERKPDWLRVKLPIGPNYKKVRSLVDEYKTSYDLPKWELPKHG